MPVLILGCAEQPKTQDDVRTMLTEQLPHGIPKKQVNEYLDKHNIPYSNCEYSELNCIQAKVSGGTQKLSIVRTDYGVTFRFNSNDTLAITEIQPYYTGP
jgi:hypothetical protein